MPTDLGSHVTITIVGPGAREGSARVISFNTRMPPRDLFQALSVMSALIRNAGTPSETPTLEG